MRKGCWIIAIVMVIFSLFIIGLWGPMVRHGRQKERDFESAAEARQAIVVGKNTWTSPRGGRYFNYVISCRLVDKDGHTGGEEFRLGVLSKVHYEAYRVGDRMSVWKLADEYRIKDPPPQIAAMGGGFSPFPIAIAVGGVGTALILILSWSGRSRNVKGKTEEA